MRGWRNQGIGREYKRTFTHGRESLQRCVALAWLMKRSDTLWPVTFSSDSLCTRLNRTTTSWLSMYGP
jgi:hypothetical protein